MVSFAVGSVVTVRFPFTDQSSSKVRPAVILAIPNHRDCILCAITSSSRWGGDSVSLKKEDFGEGTLREKESFALPSKLMTAEKSIIHEIGRLKEEKARELLSATRSLF